MLSYRYGSKTSAPDCTNANRVYAGVPNQSMMYDDFALEFYLDIYP